MFLAAQSAAIRGEVESLLRAYEQDNVLPHTSILDAGAAAWRLDRQELVGRCFGPYRVLSQLGEGGMGTVWLAERVDGVFTRRVALKLVHPALMGRTMGERVAREREILASLNHPNIALLFDAGFAEDGQPYLALEYVEGTPMTTYCDDHHLGVRKRLELFRQTLGAVQYAHSNLVIHRDLKPSNILVSEDGRVHLLDFGVAKLLTPDAGRQTQLTQFAGPALTPDYAAPEQIAGATTSTASDVYALGVILYELLSGERPYRLQRLSRGALEEAILQTEPVDPSRLSLTEGAARARATSTQKLARVLRGDLDTIIHKALKKSPSERYATANAFDEDIARFLSGEVVLARPDSRVYRFRRFVGRYRTALAAVSALILTLAAGLTATTYEAHIASLQRDAALQAQQRSITQAAAGRLKDDDIPGALNVILPVLTARGERQPYSADALRVFEEAQAADAQVLALIGHTDLVVGVAYSPDGQRIVTASYDGSARIWDAASGEPLLVLRGHASAVRSAAFSADGRRIVTASYDKTARLWGATSGELLLVLTGHTGRVRSAALSPDGRHVVTASEDGTARLWDASSGEQLEVLAGHVGYLRSAAFSADGRRIVTAADDGTARLWDATTGRQLLVLSGHSGAVDTAAFSPNGQRVVTGSEDKTARVWDAMSGQQLLVLAGHDFYVDGVSFSPDGRSIVTASGDKTVRLWDSTSGERLKVLSGHTRPIVAVAFSPDGRRLATASTDGTARTWDSASPRQLLVLSGRTGAVVDAAFSRDGRRIVTVSDSTVHVWDAHAGSELRVLRGHAGYVDTAEFSPDGSRIVTASGDTTARIWDGATGELQLTLKGHTDRVLSATFSPDGQRTLTASVDKSARIWDASSGQQLLLLSGRTADVNGAVFSPDGRRVLTASADGTARLWDSTDGRQLLVLAGHDGVLTRPGFSPDGRRLATASADKSARVWDASSGQLLLILSGHADVLSSVAFSPDSRSIVTASLDKTARVWDVATGSQLLVLAGHTNRVIHAAFSPDGQRIVTASLDGTARVWDAGVMPLAAQLATAEASQFEPLTSAERFQVGLPDPVDVRRWPADQSKCDQSAAAPYDPLRRSPGVTIEHIVADVALPACAGHTGNSTSRFAYQHGRALIASGQTSAARQDFERAIAAGHGAARIDLANLLTRPSPDFDVQGAIALYEQAWRDGVPIAAFQLGDLYEHGGSPAAGSRAQLFAPNQARAWAWYEKGASRGEPNALGRLGLREDEAAHAASNVADRDAHLLRAFRLYAAAAERARLEDWPDDAWRTWRYRRASLARLLAGRGMTQEVADTYDSVRKQYAPPVSTLPRVVSGLMGED